MMIGDWVRIILLPTGHNTIVIGIITSFFNLPGALKGLIIWVSYSNSDCHCSSGFAIGMFHHWYACIQAINQTLNVSNKLKNLVMIPITISERIGMLRTVNLVDVLNIVNSAVKSQQLRLLIALHRPNSPPAAPPIHSNKKCRHL